MMTPEEIRAIYNQGPEAVIAPVEQLYLLIGQQEEQIAHFKPGSKKWKIALPTHSRKPSSDGLVKQRRSLRESSMRKSEASRVIGARRSNRWLNLTIINPPASRPVSTAAVKRGFLWAGFSRKKLLKM
jgi:hypothetical protein